MSRLTNDLECKRNIFKNSLVGQQLVVLKYVAHIAAQIRNPRLGHLIDILPSNPHGATLGLLLTVNQSQQRRFARSGWSNQKYEGAFSDTETCIPYGHRVGAVPLGHTFQTDHGAPSRRRKVSLVYESEFARRHLK